MDQFFLADQNIQITHRLVQRGNRLCQPPHFQKPLQRFPFVPLGEIDVAQLGTGVGVVVGKVGGNHIHKWMGNAGVRPVENLVGVPIAGHIAQMQVPVDQTIGQVVAVQNSAAPLQCGDRRTQLCQFVRCGVPDRQGMRRQISDLSSQNRQATVPAACIQQVIDHSGRLHL